MGGQTGKEPSYLAPGVSVFPPADLLLIPTEETEWKLDESFRAFANGIQMPFMTEP